MNICAECLDFIECGDWDLCCKQQVRRLTYEYCEACDTFREGREIHPAIVGKLGGESKAFKPDGEVTFDECVAKAKELISEGYEDVQIRDGDKGRLYPLLWMDGGR